ncbi:MAG: S8 family serine peptidase [Chitinivibrionales bacterium]|nr:S8 family serine peptidase [Chitinivibrionales bacterium]
MLSDRLFKKSIPFGFSVLVATFVISGFFSTPSARTYWIEFSDKPQSVYTTAHPSSYLSERAIKRRLRLNIPITVEDLPVNSGYVEQIQGLGFQIKQCLKWLNGVLAIQNDTTVDVSRLLNLPFVKTVKWVDRPKPGAYKRIDKFELENTLEGGFTPSPNSQPDSGDVYNYGAGRNSIAQLNGQALHNKGYTGVGVHVAVIDGGFSYVDIMSAFDSLWINKQILGTRNFYDTLNVFRLHWHGRGVLATMAANKPGVLVGTAPKASYWLLRTEISSQDTALDREIPLEEYLWAAAAEFADSVGVDVINSSLGYTEFETNNPQADNHTWNDLDGNTAAVTRAADMAVKKGIIVVNSAGNSRAQPWKYIGCPADGDSVFSIGAIDTLGNLTSFSSCGPTADGRLKPNVVALGRRAAIIGDSGQVAFSNGTSFSSPIMAGLMACLRQKFPAMPVMDLIKMVQKYASKADSAGINYGYGIPNFKKLLDSTTNALSNKSFPSRNNSVVRLASKTCRNEVSCNLQGVVQFPITLSIYSVSGKKVAEKTYTAASASNRYTLNGLAALAEGTYCIAIKTAVSHLLYDKISLIHN